MNLQPALRLAGAAAGTVVAVAACALQAAAAFLPAQLTPAAPFPLVLAQSFEREFVAPGIERATYQLQTSAGPVVVSLVAFNPHQPTIRVGAVLAHDRIVSTGETVSAMAARTGAVAGINADYFDIGNTDSPLGVVAHAGALLRTPSSRTAFTFTRSHDVRFTPLQFRGTAVANGTTSIPLTAVNEWPPHDGAALLTPAYGVPAADAASVVAELTPVAPVAPGAPLNGRFRVTQIDLGTAPVAPTYALALGPAARRGLTALPDVGDLIDVSFDTHPPLSGLLDAVGGGPALLQNGLPVDDPSSPGYADRARRIPISAAATLASGDVVLLVIDGRRPAISIGVDRAELIALLAALGAADAMQFDSGGSATLVVRMLGEGRATLANEPSDGIERPVADGLFIYSDTPVGPPARLVLRPSAIEALPNTAIALRSSVVDAAGNALGPANGPWRSAGAGGRIDTAGVLHTGNAPLTGALTVARGGVAALLPVQIVPAVARIAIAPERPDIDPHAVLALRAQAFDDRGRRIETGAALRWSALRGSIAADGLFTAGGGDGFVTASVGAVKSSEIVHVGRHQAPLPGFDLASHGLWHFHTVPANGPGSLDVTDQGTLLLAYDFADGERAAYADAGLVLGEPLTISCAIDGDGGGAGVRVALLDRYGERSALTLAKSVDWTGTRRREVHVPAALAPPIALQSIYVVGSLGPAPVKSAGTIGVRNCAVTLPGTAALVP